MKKVELKDPNLKVKILRYTHRPQNLCALAMHNDYSEDFICDEDWWLKLDEEESGAKLIERALKFNHWGLLEHPHITFAVGGYPHSVIQQLRTHRVGVSFDVQSLRYTGKRFVEWFESLNHFTYNWTESELLNFEKLFYIRPVGKYADRFGNQIDWTEEKRQELIDLLASNVAETVNSYLVKEKMPFEMVRDFLPAGYRQNFLVTCNARSLMHLLDLRLPADAQLEIRHCLESMLKLFGLWMPEVQQYYLEKRAYKNKLAP